MISLEKPQWLSIVPVNTQIAPHCCLINQVYHHAQNSSITDIGGGHMLTGSRGKQSQHIACSLITTLFQADTSKAAS